MKGGPSMTTRKLAALALCLTLLVVLFSGCAQQEHVTIHGDALFPRYSLATATATAGEIVYGKVVGKSQPTEVIYETYYRRVNGERKQIVRGLLFHRNRRGHRLPQGWP